MKLSMYLVLLTIIILQYAITQIVPTTVAYNPTTVLFGGLQILVVIALFQVTKQYHNLFDQH